MKPQISKDFQSNYQSLVNRLKLGGLAASTIESYSHGVRRAERYFGEQVNDLDEAQLTDYFCHILNTLSWSTLKHDLYGLKFYYEHVLHKDWPAPKLVKPPKAQKLPDIVTVKQMESIIASTKMLSYRVFFYVLYSLGLRLGEGLRLTVADIDAERGRIHIRDAKGNKDRLVHLPDATLEVLRRFWSVHRHPVLLFPSRKGGLKNAHLATTGLNAHGVQQALHVVARACGLKKELPRTAYATATQPT